MKKITKQFALGICSFSGLAVLSVAPVWAISGNARVAFNANPPIAGPVAATETTTTSSDTDSTNNNSVTLHQQAKQLLEQKRQNTKATTTDHRQKACEAHKAEIDNRSKNYATAAQRHLDVFNSIFTKVEAFHDSKKLNVTNYDTLVAAAQTKQTAAQTAVDNLKSLDVSIDCTSSDPASTVAMLKSAVKDARVALQDYRTALKDLVVALKGASTSTGGNQ